MKKFLTILLCLCVMASCSRKSLYLRGLPEPCDLLTTVTVSVNMNVDLINNISNSLIYNWDENAYGELSYTLPDTIYGYFFKKSRIRNLSVMDTFIVNTPKITRILTDTNYDVLFYNQTHNSEYVHDELYTYWFTYPYRKPKTKFTFNQEFDVTYNTDEHFAFTISNMYIDTYYNKVESEVKDGVITYFYKVETEIEPMSYIYIVQLCIVDDSDEYPMNVDSCSYMGINGVAKMGELFTQKTSEDRCLIESREVKPRQTINGNYVFAEKFVTFGLMDIYNYSWTNADMEYELGIELILDDETVKKGKINISDQIRKNPKGGVITVTLNNSDINRISEPSSGGGIDVDVEEWKEEFEVVIEI